MIVIPGALFAAWWLFLRPARLRTTPTHPTRYSPSDGKPGSRSPPVSGLFGVLEEPAFHQAPAKLAAVALLLR